MCPEGILASLSSKPELQVVKNPRATSCGSKDNWSWE